MEDKNVTVYSTSTCPWCKRAKDYLNEKGVPFKDVDVAADQEAAAEMVKKSGQMGVPVIDVEGQVIVGFDQATLDKALGL